MEAAVRLHLGRITPEVAAQIIRDRSNSKYVDDSTVANPFVLNAAVIQPAAGILWHSTKMQPEAPLGEMIPLSLRDDPSTLRTIPADPRLGTPDMKLEEAVVASARDSLGTFGRGHFDIAAGGWDAIVGLSKGILDPDRLTFVRALARIRRGALVEAERILDGVDAERAPFEVAATTLLLRAVLADERGSRTDAIAGYQLALTYMGLHPEYTDTGTSTLRGIALAGMQKPLSGVDYSDIPPLLYLPN